MSNCARVGGVFWIQNGVEVKQFPFFHFFGFGSFFPKKSSEVFLFVFLKVISFVRRFSFWAERWVEGRGTRKKGGREGATQKRRRISQGKEEEEMSGDERIGEDNTMRTSKKRKIFKR